MVRFFRVYDWLIEAGAVLAAASIAFIAVGVTLDVLVRAFNLGAIKWMLELSEYLLFAMTFLGAPWVLREGAHAGVDILVASLPPRLQRVSGGIANLLGLATSAAFLWFGGMAAQSARAAGTLIYKTVVFPEWWVLALIPLCGLLLIVEFLRRIARALRGDASVIATRQATA